MSKKENLDPARISGLEREKFIVRRRDGSSRQGNRHHACSYFVLDLMHDKFALPALRAYVRSCRREYPFLAADLDKKIFQLENRQR